MGPNKKFAGIKKKNFLKAYNTRAYRMLALKSTVNTFRVENLSLAHELCSKNAP